jgi:hypothetical protein
MPEQTGLALSPQDFHFLAARRLASVPTVARPSLFCCCQGTISSVYLDIKMAQSSHFLSLLNFKEKRAVKYRPVAVNESTDDGEAQEQASLPTQSVFWTCLPWALAIVLGLVALLEAMVIDGPCHFHHVLAPSDSGSFGSGFSTDFGQSKSEDAVVTLKPD